MQKFPPPNPVENRLRMGGFVDFPILPIPPLDGGDVVARVAGDAVPGAIWGGGVLGRESGWGGVNDGGFEGEECAVL